MVVEGSNSEETTKVTVIVSSSGETVRPVIVSLITSEDTATGTCGYTCTVTYHIELCCVTYLHVFTYFHVFLSISLIVVSILLL